MFGNLGNIASLMRRAQQLSGNMEQMGEALRNKRVTGSAGGGMVEIELNGMQEVLACRIDPSLIAGGDRELIEDLVRGATNDAIAKVRQLSADTMKEMIGGEMPDLGKLFGGGEQPTNP